MMATALTLIVPNTANTAQQKNNRKRVSAAAYARHPTLGYAIAPPVPAKVQRRNLRERNRVKQVNSGFDMLRSHIPSAAKHKKMSKVDTLRHAVDYIQNLQMMLTEQENAVVSKQQSDVKRGDGCDSESPAGAHSHFAGPALQATSHLYSATPSRTPTTPHFGTSSPYDDNESGYSTSDYYAHHHHHHQQQHPHHPHHPHHLNHSPSSPGGYSDASGLGFAYAASTVSAPGYGVAVPHAHPQAYYENSDEDDLLETIVEWQNSE